MPLTADICARAVIAAARVFEVDPVRAMTAPPRSQLREVLAAAAGGLSRTLGERLVTTSAVFGVHANVIPRGRHRPQFAAAELAAARAVEFATWRPEAAETRAAANPPAPVVLASQPAAVEGSMTQLAEGPAHPEIATPAPRKLGGAISSRLAPPAWRSDLPVHSESPLRDRILDVLGEGSATAVGLASLLDAKELLVSQSLLGLEHEGLVYVCEIPAQGPRFRRWARRAAA